MSARRSVALAVLSLSIAAGAAVATTAPAAAAAPRSVARLQRGHVLSMTMALRSPNGVYSAVVGGAGRLDVLRRGVLVWGTPRPTPALVRGARARLVFRPGGDLALLSGARSLWATNTATSRASVLVLSDAGALSLRSAGGTVWSNRVGNTCARGVTRGVGKRVLISLGWQFARLCNGEEQILATPITSGASALGDATPTGTWRLQAKVRDTVLYPDGGGAYPVRYWMPYDGAYGMHDASWQRFPYGSGLYRTMGSHGCVHFPPAAVAEMFAWAPIGTLVSIRR